MYKREIIIKADGTKVMKCTRIPQPETRSLEELKDMERMSRAIEAFGTSS